VSADVPGRHLIAVEPSEGMRAALAQALPEVDVRVGTAEATGLPDASADLVAVGQAWHWFDEPAAAAEVARVLRPGGTLAVIWNERDLGVDWLERYDAIVRRGDEMDYRHPVPTLGDAFGPVETTTVRWSDTMRPADLRALAASRSHLLTLPDAEREALLAEVDDLAATHPDLRGHDLVPVPYVTEVHRARRR
jgi:SAM-dependent methyltransferase